VHGVRGGSRFAPKHTRNLEYGVELDLVNPARHLAMR